MISQQLSVLFLPFLACVILTGIHGYLGIHVLARKVIFVDIALAQIAALGATVAYLLGYDPRTEGAYYFSLAFAVLAAMIFAGTRTKHERVPQEAVIGLTYAVASAAAILVADVAPHGAEHLKDLLAGSIVWVTPHQLTKTFILYSCLGLFHFVFREKFLLISVSPHMAYEQGVSVRFWDFLFYLSFGVVITSSVQIAGVLLVFCYLVAPAVFAVMFTESLGARLALSWTVGVVVSALGLLYSYDRPSGPMIMCFFAVALILGALYQKLRQRLPAVGALAGAVGIVALALSVGRFGFSRLQLPAHEEEAATPHDENRPEPHGSQEHLIGASEQALRAALQDQHDNVRAQAALKLGESKDPEALPLLLKALLDRSDAVKENAARGLAALGDPAAVPHLKRALLSPEQDPWVHFRIEQALCGCGSAEGLGYLLETVGSHDPRLLRNQALGYLLTLTGLPGPRAGTTPSVDSPEGQKAVAELSAWWKQNGPSLKWDAAAKSYR